MCHGIRRIQMMRFYLGDEAQIPAGEIIGETPNGFKIGQLKGSENNVNPMAALSFHATDEIMLFGLYSEGFRTGGVNNNSQPFAQGIPPIYKSDELKNYEFGIKSRLLDNRMQLNATLFHIDWSDIQVEPRDPEANIPFTVNGGDAEINGLEWGLTSLLTDSLRLNFTGTWFFKHELFVSLQYDRPIGDMLLSLIGDVTYRGDTNTEFRTDNPFNIKLDSYTQVDLFANLNINEHFTVGAYVKNLGNEVGVIDGIGTFQDPEAIIALRPRTWGLRLIWRY